MRFLRTLLRPAASLALVCAAALPALAHGGSYKQPGGGGPGGPQVPPGTADPPGAITRWETWWAHNKEYFLRLAEEMRADTRVLTPKDGEARRGDGPTPAELRAEEDALVRDALVPMFVEALGDDSFEVRTAAAIALGKTGDAKGSAALRKAAETDKHKDVRDSAVLGLGLLGGEEDIPFLLRILNDDGEDTRHRSFAAFGLGLIGGDDATAALLRFFDAKVGSDGTTASQAAPDLLSSAFVALGLTGNEKVLPVLRAAFDGPRYDDNVRAFVMLSLGRVADRESLDTAIRTLVRERDAGLRRSAAIALGRIARATDVKAVDALLDALRSDKDPVTRQFAAVALGGLADADIENRLLALFEKSAPAERAFLSIAMGIARHAGAAPALRKALVTEYDDSLRSAYCISLALIGDVESVPLLEASVRDRGRIWLQGYAALSLGMLRSRRSADVLREQLEESNEPRLRANLAVGLGLLHDPRAKTYLVETLRGKGSLYERGGAAMSLGVLRMNSAVPDLIDVYRDGKEQDMIRAFAVISLGLIGDPAAVPKLARFSIDNNYTLAVDPLNEVLSIL